MSYLKKHHDNKQSKFQTKNSSSPVSTQKSKKNVRENEVISNSELEDDFLEAKFKGLKLNNYSMHSVISSLTSKVQAIDLSHNRIEDLPRGLPKSILGVNISYNKIQHFHVSKDLNHLIELNISHNHIASAAPLSVLKNLQYLNLSHNLLTKMEGLENLKALKLLNISHNLIQEMRDLRSLSYNSQLEDLDVSENPIQENVELKFFLTNLIPSIKYINQQPLKVDPNIYGYIQTLPHQLQQIHQQKPQHLSHDSEDNESINTYPQRLYYPPPPTAVIEEVAVREGEETEEEDGSSWGQGLPSEGYVGLMQGNQLTTAKSGPVPTAPPVPPPVEKKQQQQQQQQKQQLHQQQQSNDALFNKTLSLSEQSRIFQSTLRMSDFMTKPEQLDSPPNSLRNESSDLGDPHLPPGDSGSTARQSRKSRLPWRNPPNPRPRNWDELNQSVAVTHSSAKKPRRYDSDEGKGSVEQLLASLSQDYYDPSSQQTTIAVNLAGDFTTQPSVDRSSSQQFQYHPSHQDYQYPHQQDFSHYLEDPHYLQQIYDIRHPIPVPSTDTYHTVPIPPPLPVEVRTAASTPAVTQPTGGFTQPRIAPPYPLNSDISSASMPPPLESTRSSRWMSPQLSRKTRGRSPDEELMRSYIALPLPTELPHHHSSKRSGSSSTSPSLLRSVSGGIQHTPARVAAGSSSPKSGSASTTQRRYEKSPETREAYLLSQSQRKRTEVQDQFPAFISMTERQRQLWEEIRSSREKEQLQQQRRSIDLDSTTTSVHSERREVNNNNKKKNNTNTFERLNQQTIGHFKERASSETKSQSSYTEKYQLKTGTILTKKTTTTAKSYSSLAANNSTTTTTATASQQQQRVESSALIPLDQSIIEQYEQRHGPEEKQKKRSGSPKRFQPLRSPASPSKRGKQPENSPITAAPSIYEAASPYQRFLRLRKRIETKYDKDLQKIYEEYQLSERQVLEFMRVFEKQQQQQKGSHSVTGSSHHSHKSFYDYLLPLEQQVEETIRNGGGEERELSNEEQNRLVVQQMLKQQQQQRRSNAGEYSPSDISMTSRPPRFPLSTHNHNTATTATATATNGTAPNSRPPSALSFNSTMMSLDSLPPYTANTSNASSRRPSFNAVHATTGSLVTTTPITSLEQEAFRLSQEIESLKMKKLQELSTNQATTTLLAMHQTNHPIYDHHLVSSDAYQQRHNPPQVFHQNSLQQQRSLAYHLQYMQEMLQKTQLAMETTGESKETRNPLERITTASTTTGRGPPPTLEEIAASSTTATTSSNHHRSRETTAATEKFIFPSLALYDQSATPTTATALHSTAKVSIPEELPTLEQLSRTNSQDILEVINRSFDHLHVENLNFQEMQQAIESLKSQQIKSLQQLQRQ